MNGPDRVRNSAGFLFDLDGTVYLGSKLLPGARDLLAFLAKEGRPYFFLTNNSSRSRDDYALKLERFGLDVGREQILSSGLAAAIALGKQTPRARIYLVGTPSLEAEFRGRGFQLVEDDPDYAVLGYDTTLTYDKVRRLCDLLLEGVPYIATHPDLNCPTAVGFSPDIGAIMALVEAVTGRTPDQIMGKPYQPMIDAVTSLTGIAADQLTMVGDRLYTDIALGKAGLGTVLVLSGETHLEDLAGSPYQPDLVCQDLGGLLELLQVRSG